MNWPANPALQQLKGNGLDGTAGEWRGYYAPRRNRTYNLLHRVPSGTPETTPFQWVPARLFFGPTPETPPKTRHEQQLNGNRLPAMATTRSAP